MDNSKNLSNWLDSLPRSEAGQSPNTTAHDLSMSNSTDLNNGNTNTLNRRTSNTHTLTKTNPYRHKVLTNGSFLNLNIKESPPQTNVVTNSGLVSSSGVSSGGSDNGSNSSRPTTSTEDNNSESESSKGLNTVNTASVINLRRSNTTLATNRHMLPAEETVLPPPDAFGNTSSTVIGRNKANYSTLGRYPIDTSTAKAIIDTYSGNLFSRSSNYLSFRERERQEQLGRSNSTLVSPERLINVNFAAGMEADSLEVYPVTPSVYSPTTVLYNNNLDGWDGQTGTAPSRTYSKKTRRTESVV
jgi:hypothetical protein